MISAWTANAVEGVLGESRKNGLPATPYNLDRKFVVARNRDIP